jgi:hypothetical protein
MARVRGAVQGRNGQGVASEIGAERGFDERRFGVGIDQRLGATASANGLTVKLAVRCIGPSVPRSAPQDSSQSTDDSEPAWRGPLPAIAPSER